MRRTVQDVMTRDVVVAHPTTSFKQLTRLLAEHRIAALPVIDDAGHPVGIVSETDLTARQVAEDLVDAGSTAADVMTTPAITINPERRSSGPPGGCRTAKSGACWSWTGPAGWPAS